MTSPSKKLGYKVGDLFVYTGSYTFTSGSIIELINDDLAENPAFKLVEGSYKSRVDKNRGYAYSHLDCIKPYSKYPTQDFKIDLSKLSEAEKEVAKGWLKEAAKSKGLGLGALEEGCFENYFWLITDNEIVTGVPNNFADHYDTELTPELSLTFSKPTITSWSIEQKKSEKELQLEALVDKLQKQLEEAKSELSKLK